MFCCLDDDKNRGFFVLNYDGTTYIVYSVKFLIHVQK